MACTIIATSMLEQKVSYSGIKVSSSQAVVAITSHFPGIHKTIAALVIGRTKSQCYSRWYDALNHSIALAKEAT